MSFFEFPNTRTYDNDLGWLIRNVKSAEDAVKKLEEFMADSQDAFDQLNKLLDDIAAGAFPEEISNAIRNYIVKNFYDIVGDMAMTVWFGLTDGGYFVAYVPESWDEIKFKTTGYDYETELQPEYGHLVLQANYYTHSNN